MEHAANGILLVDKAEGWTSHDVVAKARRALGTRKVGHAGTLDPMATGLLLLGAGHSTRLLTHLVGLDKSYTATIRLGITTLSDDREGALLDVAEGVRIRELAAQPDRLRAAALALTGAIEQVPSAVSAIKVDGRRAYDRVRAGEQVELQKRPVTIHAFELGQPRLVTIELPAAGPDAAGHDAAGQDAAAGQDTVGHDAVDPDVPAGPIEVLDVDATVRCSSGSYVRALARDLGAALGVGGHLIALRRTEVEPFSVADAMPTEQLAQGGIAPARLLPPAQVAASLFPVLALTAAQEVDLGHGKRLELGEDQRLGDGSERAKLAAAIAPSGRLVGLVEVKQGRARAVTNFPTPDSEVGGSA